MADRPILFSAPMIRAILRETDQPGAGKTQTRRIITNVPPQPKASCHPNLTERHAAPYLDAYCSERKTAQNPRGMSTEWCWWQVDNRQGWPSFKVKCQPGDRLWVRETWAAGTIYDGVPPRDINPDGKPGWCGIRYAATDSRSGIKDRPSIHMPRWVSRITLLVTGVKVERLQDISEEDARAEGFAPREELRAVGMTPTARGTFSKYWDEINRGSIPRNPNSWAGNPWVAAYTFKPVLANIDALGEVA